MQSQRYELEAVESLAVSGPQPFSLLSHHFVPASQPPPRWLAHGTQPPPRWLAHGQLRRLGSDVHLGLQDETQDAELIITLKEF